MRKSFITFCILLTICLGGIITAHGLLCPEDNGVNLTEKILYGDKAEAEGLSISTSYVSDSHLFWKTNYTIKDKNTINTEFNYSLKRESGTNTASKCSLCLVPHTDYETSDCYTLYRNNPEIKLIADKTKSGETYTEKIHLKDYYQFFPLDFNLTINELEYPDESKDKIDEYNKNKIYSLNNWFAIPIPESYTQSITVTKDKDGNISNIASKACNYKNLKISSLCTATEASIYFSPNSSDFSEISDLSEINESGENTYNPEQYSGLYKLPYDKTSSCNINPNVKMLKCVYSLDSKAKILKINSNKSNSKILILTTENDINYFVVIDSESDEILQKIQIPVGEIEKSELNKPGISNAYFYDDYISIVDTNGRITLIELNNYNEYVPVFTTDAVLYKNEIPLNSLSGIAWDGEKLAIASYDKQYYNLNNKLHEIDLKCGFLVYVFNKQGTLLFNGLYENSLDFENVDFSENDGSEKIYSGKQKFSRCRPVKNQSISVFW